MPTLLQRSEINKQLGISRPESYPTDLFPDVLRLALLKSLTGALRRHAGSLAGKRVLFIGGGVGREIIQLHSRENFSSVNVDINLGLLQKAADHYRSNHLPCLCVAANGMQLPFRDNAFDLAVLYESLHHMDDIPLCLEESLRVAGSLCVIDRRQCFISKLGRRWGLIWPEVDGFYAKELDLRWLREWIGAHAQLQLRYLRHHFLFLLVINKSIHGCLIRFPWICYLDILCVKIINALFGFMGNGVIFVIKKKDGQPRS